MKIVKLPEVKPNQSAIDYAQGLLERCESGEVLEVFAVEVYANDDYHTTGTTSDSSAKRTGMLFSAAVDSANYASI